MRGSQIIVSFLDVVETVDVLIAIKDGVKTSKFEIRTVHFARVKSSYLFDGINKLDRDYSY